MGWCRTGSRGACSLSGSAYGERGRDRGQGEMGEGTGGQRGGGGGDWGGHEVSIADVCS